jgi:hypothetical protein
VVFLAAGFLAGAFLAVAAFFLVAIRSVPPFFEWQLYEAPSAGSTIIFDCF